MQCLNINLPSIRKNLDDLTKLTGDKEVAYATLASNNGYTMKQTMTGKVSSLYNELEAISNIPEEAEILKMNVHSSEFIEKFGDWRNLKQGRLNTDNEPKLFTETGKYYYIGEKNKRISIKVNKPASFKKVAPLTSEETNNALKKQYTKDTEGPIKKGSFVSFKSKDGGITDAMVYKVNPNGSFNLFNTTTVTKDHIGILQNKTPRQLTKKGDYHTIGGAKGKPEVLVLYANKDRKEPLILNIKDKISVNKQSSNIQQNYIDAAVQYGLSKEPTIKPTETVETKPLHTDKDKVFVHAENVQEVDEVKAGIDEDISNGVKVFMVLPPQFANQHDMAISAYLTDMDWVYNVNEGVAYFAKPKAKIPTTESQKVPGPTQSFSKRTPGTITDSKGNLHKLGTLAANMIQFLQEKRQDALPYLRQGKQLVSKIERALLKAVPDATLFIYNKIPEVVLANRQLKERIATDSKDPRIRQVTGSDNIDLYNSLMYDLYTETVHRAMQLDRKVPGKGGSFNLRSDHIQAKLRNDIRSLEERKLNLQNTGAANKDIDAVTTEINDINAILEQDVEEYNLKTLKDIAKTDLAKARRILAKENISPDEFVRAKNILQNWIDVGNFEDTDKNIFLDESQAVNPEIQKDFKEIANEAESIKDTSLNNKGRNLITSKISSTLNKVFNFNDITKLKNKVNGWFKTVFSIAKVDNPTVAYIMKTINTAAKKAEVKAITESNHLAELYETLRQKGFDFELFWQKDKDGTVTGNLVSEYTSEYLKRLRNFKRGYGRLSDYKNDNVFIDVSRLAGASTLAIEKYVEELTPIIGRDKAISAVAEADMLFKRYMEIKDHYLMAEFGVENEEELEAGSEEASRMLQWKIQNSPAIRAAAIDKANTGTFNEIQGAAADRFLVTVPKKFDENGKPTELYDDTFTSITEDTDAAAFYKRAYEITKKAKEHFNTSGMTEYALGAIQNTILEEYQEHGIKEFTKKTLWDNAVNYAAGKDNKKEITDPVTGKTVKVLDKGVQTLESLISKEMKNIHEVRELNPQQIRELSAEDRAEIYREASDIVMKSHSGDIFKALNSLNLAALSYGYKSAIKPEIDMALHYLEQMEAGISDEEFSFGDIDSKDVGNVKDMVDYFIDREYFDIGNQDKSMKLPISVYTSDEKRRRKQLLEQLERLATDQTLKGKTTKKRLETELKEIGRNVTVNSILKSLMDFMRISTMGWNIQSAIANFMQGQIVNIIHAAEGKLFTWETLKAAYSTVFTEKFDNIIKNYAVLGDIMYDFERKNPFEKKKGVFGKIKSAVMPYAGTKIAEKLNQGNITVAMLMHMQVQDKNGNDISIWDAIDDKGTLSKEYTFNGQKGDAAIAEVIIPIRDQINLIHGDYNNAKLLGKTIVGKAASMFHLWFFEPYHAHFGARKYNAILGRETRGRVLSAMELIPKYGLSYKKMRQARATEKITEVDLNNIKVLFMELSAIAVTGLLSLLAKATLCNDEETKCGGVGTTYLVNTLNRIAREVKTFTDPTAYYDLVTNPVAVARYLKSIARIFQYMSDAAAGEDMDNKDGDNKILITLSKEFPILRRLIIERDLMENIRNY